MEFGFNVNGVGMRKNIISACRTAQEGGFSSLWVGESRGFAGPFSVMPLVAHNAPEMRIGSGAVSTMLHHPRQIEWLFKNLISVYGQRFVCGLSPGDARNLRDAGVETRGMLKSVRRCVEHLRAAMHLRDLPVHVGAAGPKMLRMAAEIADGVQFNYVNPRLVEWALEKACGARRTYAYGPALVLPEEPLLRRNLCKATAIVAASLPRAALEECGIDGRVDAVRKLVERGDVEGLAEHREFLLEWFAIAGGEKEFKSRLRRLEDIGMDGVIFAVPPGGDGVARQAKALSRIIY